MASARDKVARPLLMQHVPLATQTVKIRANTVSTGSISYECNTLYSRALLRQSPSQSDTTCSKQMMALNSKAPEFARCNPTLPWHPDQHTNSVIVWSFDGSHIYCRVSSQHGTRHGLFPDSDDPKRVDLTHKTEQLSFSLYQHEAPTHARRLNSLTRSP